MDWKRSITNVLLFNFLNNISFERVLWVVYLLNKNISLIEIGLVQSVLNISMFIFEFPTGFIGDRYGRKTSLFIGNLMITIYLCIFLFSSKFYQFCIGSIFYGLGMTFISGSNEALVYDNLKGLNKEDRYNDILSKINFISILGLLISTFLGGVFEKVSLSLIFTVGIAVRIVAGILILFIKEYPYLSENEEPVFLDLKASINFIKNNRSLIYFLITSSLFVSFFSVYALFGQEILRENGESSLYKISIIYMFMYALGGVISLIYNKLTKIFSLRSLIFYNSLVTGIFLFFSIFKGMNSYYYIIFIVIGGLYEIHGLTYDIIINSLSTSNLRARIFSIYSFITTIFMSFFSIVTTYILSNELINFNERFFVISIIVLVISTYGTFITIKNKNL